MLVWDDDRVFTFDMKTLAERDLTDSIAGSSQATRTFADPEYTTALFFTCENGCDDILTVEEVKKVWKYEKLFIDDPKYSKTCLAVSNLDPNCNPSGRASIPKYFETQLIAGTLN